LVKSNAGGSSNQNQSGELNKALATVNLASKEKIVATFPEFTRCDIFGGEYTRKKGLFSTEKITVKSSMVGYLLATNLHLVFVERRGIVNFSYHCKLRIPLEKIVGVSACGWWTRYVAIVDSDGLEYRFPINKEKENEMKNMIDLLIHQRRTSLEEEEKSKKVQVVIDFSFLRSIAEKGGLLLTTISCPHCGGPVKLPESGNICKCDHCQREICAFDIFEKIKQLLSNI